MLKLIAYSYEYDPKAVDNEEKNSENFSKFADECGIPNVSLSFLYWHQCKRLISSMRLHV
jgi:hypothetical protein